MTGEPEPGLMKTGHIMVVLDRRDWAESVALADGIGCSKHDQEGRNEGRQEESEDEYTDLNAHRILTAEP